MGLTAYELGEVAQLDFTVRTVTGTLVDPAAITAEARRPTGFVDDITDLITNPGSATGIYQILLPLGLAGDWNVEIVTTDPDDTQRFPLYVSPDTVELSTLNPDALTTLSKARIHVLRNVTNTDTDELLAFLINASSTAIYNYTNREFKPADADTRVFSYDGDGMLSFSPSEVRSVTSVSYQADGTTLSRVLTSRYYRLEPAQKTPEGTYLSLRLPSGGGFWLDPNVLNFTPVWNSAAGGEITITGDWGMEAVPADVELACLVMVADGFRNPGSITAYASAGGFVAGEPLTGPSGSIPIGARRLLYPYRRQRRVGSVRLYGQRQYGRGLPVV